MKTSRITQIFLMNINVDNSNFININNDTVIRILEAKMNTSVSN